MSAPDVVVVGAGIVGASTAWELSVRGARVLLIDAGAVSGGTTGLGEGNVLCSDKDAGPELELTRLGLARYAAIEAELGPVARIRRKGALVVHPDAGTWAAEPARVARMRAAGVVARLLEPPEVRMLEPALTGAIMCMGTATANTILVVAFARERLDEHGDSERAAIEAGEGRIRPVLMTALAMIVGMIPMSLSNTQNAPLGRAVIGGLIVATFTTLLFIPNVFAILHRNGKPGQQEQEGQGATAGHPRQEQAA